MFFSGPKHSSVCIWPKQIWEILKNHHFQQKWPSFNHAPFFLEKQIIFNCKTRPLNCPTFLFYPFHATGLFQYPPENIRKPMVFWCFQRVSKETNAMIWVNVILLHQQLFKNIWWHTLTPKLCKHLKLIFQNANTPNTAKVFWSF